MKNHSYDIQDFRKNARRLAVAGPDELDGRCVKPRSRNQAKIFGSLKRQERRALRRMSFATLCWVDEFVT